MEQNLLSINKKTYVSVILILLLLIITSGILTQVIPGGSYERYEIDGVEKLVEGSFQYTNTLHSFLS